ncbi:MAG: permease [Endomicrobia bacterium]|nr:permease [Endomicrobiia bacterium]
MKILIDFWFHLKHYTVEILPVLAVGFLLSGIFYELVPGDVVRKYLGKKNFFTLFSIIIVGMILPICCIGSLPMAVGFRQKGVRLGNVLAFLVATPATSVSSILVTLKFFGVGFTLYLCLSVIILGFVIGIIGNLIDTTKHEDISKTEQTTAEFLAEYITKKTFKQKILSMLKYAFIYLPKEIGVEILIGLLLASFISSLNIIKIFVENFLFGIYGYLFSVIFGVLMYICSTASVPLVYALHIQGLDVGPSLVLLILGPLTSYATLLVIRKEFGIKIFSIYLITIISFSLICGYIFNLITL